MVFIALQLALYREQSAYGLIVACAEPVLFEPLIRYTRTVHTPFTVDALGKNTDTTTFAVVP